MAASFDKRSSREGSAEKGGKESGGSEEGGMDKWCGMKVLEKRSEIDDGKRYHANALLRQCRQI